MDIFKSMNQTKVADFSVFNRRKRTLLQQKNRKKPLLNKILFPKKKVLRAE